MLFWKFFLIGLVGNFLHVLKSSIDQKVSIFVYAKTNAQEIMFGLLSYVALIWLWYYGEGFDVINYVLGIAGIDPIERMPLNVLTVFVGYFSSSIMSAFLTVAQSILAKARNLTSVFANKLGSTREPDNNNKPKE